ncbi:OmpA/MotB family protein [Polaribacter aquimarinus]|uniref:Cell envelope biogenesis protein OmpA n=1 Tax=Polaribacter aquimarinus TaxID=2100726 RepID=A0A2U2JB13_9FLAO|nr:OmpA family protein [Polaribacter aquimarinus]PWG05522.1 cell envelope biogenesis protein OmpA [Polaribacter aquimarinus]
MKKNLVLPFIVLMLMFVSCVSKKKYSELESEYKITKSNLQTLKLKFSKIENRVKLYNNKINSLRSENVTLEKENAIEFKMVDGVPKVSKKVRKMMDETIKKLNPKKLAKAKTFKDTLNLVVSYNVFKKTLVSRELQNSSDINIDIGQTVVMISVSDKLLFNKGSYKVRKEALKLVTKLADIIQSEPSMDVMIEGHTDSQTINNKSVQDNWDLSVKRATSIVRLLQNKFGIEGNRLIASGRGDTMPLFPNTNPKNRAKNRRTRILILPNLDKFFALLAEEGVIEIKD